MTLEQFAATLAEHIVQDRGWTMEQARRWIDQHLREARAEYHTAGAPLGDTEAGLLAWLLPRHQPPTA